MLREKPDMSYDSTLILLRKVDSVNFYRRQHNNINFILGVLSFKYADLSILCNSVERKEILKQMFPVGKLLF